jgi:hypothetical protein
MIGRDRCRIDSWFLRLCAHGLRLPELDRAADETARAFWLRQLEQLKFCSRPWAFADLTLLTPELFDLAAMQIATCASDMAQDCLALRSKVLPPEARQ